MLGLRSFKPYQKSHGKVIEEICRKMAEEFPGGKVWNSDKRRASPSIALEWEGAWPDAIVEKADRTLLVIEVGGTQAHKITFYLCVPQISEIRWYDLFGGMVARWTTEQEDFTGNNILQMIAAVHPVRLRKGETPIHYLARRAEKSSRDLIEIQRALREAQGELFSLRQENQKLREHISWLKNEIQTQEGKFKDRLRHSLLGKIIEASKEGGS